MNTPIILGIGHLLLSAPHSVDHARNDYIKPKEENTRKICIKASQYLKGTVSALVWKWKSRITMYDPNYTEDESLESSPWYQKLKEHKTQYGNKAKLIDIHGMSDKRIYAISPGDAACCDMNWSRRFDKALEKYMPDYSSNHIGALCGNWGSGLNTVSQMAMSLDIPAIQLELNPSTRKILIESSAEFQKFINFIREVADS